ncbi:hypothetical protein EFO87_15625 [Lactiplantibacillus plantarum]|nr:hypothetical protein [Lactiplantibacillus plantarum]
MYARTSPDRRTFSRYATTLAGSTYSLNSGLMSPYPITTPVKYAAAATTSNWWMGGNHKELEVGTRRIDCEVCRLFAFVSAIVGSSSSRVDRSFVKHLGLNWSRCFYYAAALLLLALNQTRSRNIRLMKLFQFV